MFPIQVVDDDDVSIQIVDDDVSIQIADDVVVSIQIAV